MVVSERDELGTGRSVEEADRDTKGSQLAKAEAAAYLTCGEGSFRMRPALRGFGTLYLCSRI